MDKATAVILINYKKPNYTINCISSLFRFCNENLFDIIVVDNNSADGSVEKIKSQFPGITCIEAQHNLGFAEGNNVGLRLSIQKGYQYSLVINNDTIVDEDLIGKLINHLNNHPGTVAVQPAIYWMHQTDKLWNGPGYYNKWLGNTYNKNGDNTKHLTKSIKAEWLTGCCMLLKNEGLKQTGLFNSRFFLYYEDVELSYRLRENGSQLDYLPTVKLYHEAGVSGKNETQTAEGFLSPIIHYYMSRNHLWFIRRYGVAILYPLNLIYNLPYYFSLWVYFKIRGRRQKANFLLKGLKEGLFTPQHQIWVNE